MGSLFGGAPPQQAAVAAPVLTPPPLPVLATPAPMPIADKDDERRAALRNMAMANAGKTTRANTIIGQDSNDESLG